MSQLLINGTAIDKAKLLMLIARNKKINAIKLIRNHVKLSLKECKDIVDNLEHNPYHYANDTIDVSTNIDFTETDFQQTSSRRKRGNHIIKDTKSNTKNYIIIALAVVIAILGYLMTVK